MLLLELYQYKGDDIRMCSALQGLIDEGRNEIIAGTIRILKNLHIPDDLITENIQLEFGLSPDTIKKLMN